MRVGDLKHRIDLEYQVNTADGMGNFTTVWTANATNLSAAIWPVSANQVINAGQQTMLITHRIRIRKRAGIKSTWRVKYRTRSFDIVSVIEPDMANRWMDLMCREVEA